MNSLKITLTVSLESARLDRALLEEIQKSNPKISRNQLKSWFGQNKILLRGRPISPSLKLTSGNYEIEIHLNSNSLHEIPTQAEASASLQSASMPSSIIYETSELLVIHKPSGMPSVPHRSEETETAVGLALAHCPELKKKFKARPLEPGLLHRLDTGTSGLLVFAKTDATFERLSQAWQERKVSKIYRAWVSLSPRVNPSPPRELGHNERGPDEPNRNPGLPGLNQPAELPISLPLTLRTPLVHDAKSSKRMRPWKDTLRPNAFRGTPLEAITHITQVHSELFLTKFNRPAWDLEIQIETGVMHQIRCHLASLNLPLLGDSIYRGYPSTRLWLHAWQLTLPNERGEPLKLQANLPESWTHPCVSLESTRS